MKENSIEEDIEILSRIRNDYQECKKNCKEFTSNVTTINREEYEALDHILLDYKRVLKENEIYKKNSEIMSKENLSTAEQLKVEIKENFRLKNQLENNRKEYQETYKDVRKELKELKKENEELKNAVNIVNKEKSDWIRAYQEEKDKQFELLRSNIPVQKVKDKIEELEEQYNVRELDFIKTTQDIRKIIIQSLEELIEGKK